MVAIEFPVADGGLELWRTGSDGLRSGVLVDGSKMSIFGCSVVGRSAVGGSST